MTGARRARWRLAASRGAFYVAFLAAAGWLLTGGPAPLAPPLGPLAARVGAFAALAVLGRFAHPEKPAWGVFAALALFAGALALRAGDAPAFAAGVAGSAAAWLAKPPQQPPAARGVGGA